MRTKILILTIFFLAMLQIQAQKNKILNYKCTRNELSSLSIYELLAAADKTKDYSKYKIVSFEVSGMVKATYQAEASNSDKMTAGQAYIIHNARVKPGKISVYVENIKATEAGKNGYLKLNGVAVVLTD